MVHTITWSLPAPPADIEFDEYEHVYAIIGPGIPRLTEMFVAHELQVNFKKKKRDKSSDKVDAKLFNNVGTNLRAVFFNNRLYCIH